jgi:sarcosine oxidase subunit alpha
MLKADRKKLVGLLTVDPKIVLEEGAQLVTDANQPLPMKMIGHVTSSYFSATLGRSIALAMVANATKGAHLFAPMSGGAIEVAIVDPVFFDPGGARLDG